LRFALALGLQHRFCHFLYEQRDSIGALDRLEGFASEFGPRFYGLPANEGSLTLEARSWQVPRSYPFGSEDLVPLRAGELVRWRVMP